MEKITLTAEQMDRLKAIELEILVEVDRICRKHGIEYVIAYGTLIGAIRHNGFIPWDDDVDICMTRENYLRFREVCRTELDERFFYQSHETDKNYFYLFDKIRANGTVFKETFLAEHDIHHGVYLDVFPVDALPDNKYLRKLHYGKFRLCRLILQSKYLALNARQGKKKKEAAMIRILFAPFSLEFLYRQAEKTAMKCNGNPGKDVCCYTSTYGKKDIFPAAFFTDIVDGCFEGHTVKIPAHYDALMKKIYGNYMQLPPEEKRCSVHDLLEVQL